MFVQTDDYQYRQFMGDREYLLVEMDMFCSVWTGTVGLNDYSRGEIETIVSSYYPSYEEFLKSYPAASKEDIDALVAEMVFETEMLEHTCHRFSSKEEAESFLQSYLEEHDNDKEQER